MFSNVQNAAFSTPGNEKERIMKVGSVLNVINTLPNGMWLLLSSKATTMYLDGVLVTNYTSILESAEDDTVMYAVPFSEFKKYLTQIPDSNDEKIKIQAKDHYLSIITKNSRGRIALKNDILDMDSLSELFLEEDNVMVVNRVLENFPEILSKMCGATSKSAGELLSNIILLSNGTFIAADNMQAVLIKSKNRVDLDNTDKMFIPATVAAVLSKYAIYGVNMDKDYLRFFTFGHALSKSDIRISITCRNPAQDDWDISRILSIFEEEVRVKDTLELADSEFFKAVAKIGKFSAGKNDAEKTVKITLQGNTAIISSVSSYDTKVRKSVPILYDTEEAISFYASPNLLLKMDNSSRLRLEITENYIRCRHNDTTYILAIAS